MNRRDWVARARVVADRHAQTDPEGAAGVGLRVEPERTLLAELHKLVSAAPVALLDTFRNYPEKALVERVKPRVDAIWEERFDWAADTDGPEAWLLAAVVQVRALDEALATGLSDVGHGPREPQHWAVPEQEVYVIPRSSNRFDGTEPKGSEPYSRRGLRFHTVLPMEIGGFRVRPIQLPPGPLPDGHLALGAALFREPSLGLRVAEDGPNGKLFLAEKFDAASMQESIQQQVSAAFSDGCFAAVWPELTMPSENRKALSGHLAMEALRHGPDRPLRLVVAGTWHEPREDGGWSNLAHILNRTGETLCTYAKFAAFHDEEWGEEAIVRGEELPIIVADDRVIGVAICKDFCDRAVASPFAGVPVDLMLVPSMGGSATLAGHVANAEDLRLRNGTLVFVVQQLPPHAAPPSTGTKVLGHVLLSKKKAEPEPQDQIWKVHHSPNQRRTGANPGVTAPDPLPST